LQRVWHVVAVFLSSATILMRSIEAELGKQDL
jgi:hypothetical protein